MSNKKAEEENMCKHKSGTICKLTEKPIPLYHTRYCNGGKRIHWNMPHCHEPVK